jgi:hypothetical protein
MTSSVVMFDLNHGHNRVRVCDCENRKIGNSKRVDELAPSSTHICICALQNPKRFFLRASSRFIHTGITLFFSFAATRPCYCLLFSSVLNRKCFIVAARSQLSVDAARQTERERRRKNSRRDKAKRRVSRRNEPSCWCGYEGCC